MRAAIRKNAKVPGWVKRGLAQRGFESLEGAMAAELFRHLEAKPCLIQSKRVGHILDLLSRLGRNSRDWPALHHLREPLKRYKWRYGLTLSSNGLEARLFLAKSISEENEWEYNAVRFLLSLVPHHIHRLRRCAYNGCQGWFFAEKREDQKFCKRGACRQNYYDSDTERRERKKAKMRENRKWHREQDKRALRSSGKAGEKASGR